MGVWVRSEEDGVDYVGDNSDTENSGVDIPAGEELLDLRVELPENGATLGHSDICIRFGQGVSSNGIIYQLDSLCSLISIVDHSRLE